MRRSRLASSVVLLSLVLGSCSATGATDATGASSSTSESSSSSTSTSTAVTEPPTTSAPSITTTRPSTTTPRPDWLGTRVLPVGPDGYGEIRPTPPELVDRRFATIDVLPPPATDEYQPTVETVPPEVVARSTWSDGCPVALGDLRYLTIPFWGFDEELHTGELLVNVDAVDAVIAGFHTLFDRRFPIESMRIASVADRDAPPTGDGNDTGAFVCRPARGATSWSEHAYGRAVDINPFQNPYVKGDVVLPELASAYADRSVHRAGMLTADDVAGFLAAGWGWGARWSSLKDNMHVSADDR